MWFTRICLKSKNNKFLDIWLYHNYDHTASFRHKSKTNETELSKHIWTLNDNNKPFTIKCRVLKQCKPYNSISNKCNLCLFEKYVIICKKNLCSLNKRNELASSCPHRTRYLLKNFVIKPDTIFLQHTIYFITLSRLSSPVLNVT